MYSSLICLRRSFASVATTSTILPVPLVGPQFKSQLLKPTVAQNLLGLAQFNKSPSDHLNATTTLPYQIQNPDLPEDASRIKKLLAIGKEYVKLYKSGITNVWKNNRESKRIKKTLLANNVHELTSSVLEKQGIDRILTTVRNEQQAEADDKASTSVEIQKPSEGNLTRAQYQLLLRTPMDFFKLPLFSIIFAIFFETTPLLVLIFPHIVPSTCLIPRQQKSEVLRNNRNINALKELAQKPTDSDAAHKLFSRSVYNLSTAELRALSKSLNLFSSLIPMSLISRSSLETKLKSHIEEIKCDDTLIGWYGGVWGLSTQELTKACHARAISTENLSEQEQKVRLFSWIVNFADGRFDAGFFFHSLESSPESYKELLEVAQAIKDAN